MKRIYSETKARGRDTTELSLLNGNRFLDDIWLYICTPCYYIISFILLEGVMMHQCYNKTLFFFLFCFLFVGDLGASPPNPQKNFGIKTSDCILDQFNR